MTSGTYMIINKKTGQMYVGTSINIERRWKQHCTYINLVDVDITLLGANNFDCYVLEEIDDYHNNPYVYRSENKWIRYFNTVEDEHHYNKVYAPDDDYMHFGYRNRKRKLPYIKKWIGD